ncbi:hypothetical protein BDZ97DRAFT_1650694 [Flammula alnicola]|nr:hypothetical protein BDZ97DRAFT_1650694 [Flammula alnicola]
MVNPGAFRGSRKVFLMSQKEAYIEAVAGNYAAEAVALIQRRYFKRYPVELPHDVEPSEEHLAAVDDDAIDADYKEPDAEKLSPEEYAEALVMLERRQKILEFRRAQIKRWFAYQYMKDHDLDPKETGAHNPYRALLYKLTGKESNRPRLKPPVNGIQRSGLASLREKIVRELFAKLPEDERRRWRQTATREHGEAEKAWKKEMESPPSTSPEDRQRCIMGLVRFAQPILDMICEATGWKATLIAGGPEPAHDGRLNVISIHSGTTTGDIPMNFGCAERMRYKEYFVPIYGSFLQKCYFPGMDTSSGQQNAPTSQPPARQLTPTPAPPHPPSQAPSSSDQQSQPLSRAPSPSHGPLSNTPPASPLHHSPPNSLPPSPSGHRSPPNSPSAASDSAALTEGATGEAAASDSAETLPPPKRVKRTRGKPAQPAVAPSSTSDSTAPPAHVRPTRSKPAGTSGATLSQPAPASFPPTTSPAPSTSSIEVPPGAPKWFTNILSMLRHEDVGSHPRWTELVEKWAAFEIQSDFEEVAKLKTTNQPAAIGAWIQRYRSPSWRPTISDPNEYGASFMAKPGLNGLVSVMAGLFYWGCAIESAQEGQDKWLVAVEDCLTTYVHLLVN